MFYADIYISSWLTKDSVQDNVFQQAGVSAWLAMCSRPTRNNNAQTAHPLFTFSSLLQRLKSDSNLVKIP